MNKSEFKPCSVCHKGVAHTGVPLFWRISIERMGLNAAACHRQHGMEQFFGGATPGAVALADIFSSGDSLADRIGDSDQLLICETCISTRVNLAELVENESDRKEALTLTQTVAA